MEFKNIIDNRYSSRSFSDKQVSLDVLKQIISDAQTTASWVNSQPWKVYIATGEKLTAIKKKHLELIAAGRPSSPVFPVLGRNLWHQDQQENMAAWSQEKKTFNIYQTRFSDNSMKHFSAHQLSSTLLSQRIHLIGQNLTSVPSFKLPPFQLSIKA